jgi:hypothetical protein
VTPRPRVWLRCTDGEPLAGVQLRALTVGMIAPAQLQDHGCDDGAPGC